MEKVENSTFLELLHRILAPTNITPNIMLGYTLPFQGCDCKCKSWNNQVFARNRYTAQKHLVDFVHINVVKYIYI